ncbi:Mitogen-activated protein kinase kinase 2 [Pseudocercospora fuligena]|uniref:Mitogen-activated protein kinase kinase 2 n=1 Tax=Pseudocercospora fuligena TaxID=685502 RepID=A0A8H6RBH5_9PEZI|nr:Mitogen-activated protein kinase kinase 2 [Pseudocercospora fuligena]
MLKVDELRAAVADADNFLTKDRTGLVHQHTLDSLRSQLKNRSKSLFGPTAEVDILELDSHAHDYVESTARSSDQLKDGLLRPLRQHRNDPIQRLIFVKAPHSRAPLKISQRMLLELFAYHQVSPAFLEFVFPFGNQHYVRDVFSGFRSQTHRDTPKPSLVVSELNRSGRHIDLCYNLKSVECDFESTQPWAIRQCSLHHRFDLISEQSTWIVLKANKVIQRAIRSQLFQAKVEETAIDAFATSIAIHRVVTDWACENWHWYIGSLEETLQDKTRRLLVLSVEYNAAEHSPTNPSPSIPSPCTPSRSSTWQSMGHSFRRVTSWKTIKDDATLIPTDASFDLLPLSQDVSLQQPSAALDEFSFSDLQRIQNIEDKANEALLILKMNAQVIAELNREYGSLSDHSRPLIDVVNRSRSQLEDFRRHLAGNVQDLLMQHSRLEALIRVCADRKSLLQGILQYRSMQLSRDLAIKTHYSTINMENMTTQMHDIAKKTLVETVSMRIITVVTLLFLPGTFISTLMSTPIVAFKDGAVGFSGQNIGSGALKLYLIVSLPLMSITLLAWGFMIWREKHRVKKLGQNLAGQLSPDRTFIPAAVVEDYLREGKYWRARKLLQEVCDSEEDARAVADDYPRIFCILAELGRRKARLIKQFVRNPSFSDTRLPFGDASRPPRSFPADPNDASFYEKFYKAQWKYCAPELRAHTRLDWPDEYILPFTHLKRKDEGHDAKVYRAEIHIAHDKLSSRPSETQCYALKSFRKSGEGTQAHERETTAFTHITNLGSRQTPGLITYYSSFTHLGTFNIILEFAEVGNLEEFYESAIRPVGGEQIINFWENLFDTTKALFTIHESYLGQRASGNHLLPQGWHHDLKPANILVSHCNRRLYPYCFKIADLGLAHFKTVIEGDDEAEVRARFGTRTYGPPECYAPSSFTTNQKHDVKRSIDIWSLGCVYSEAAVWLVQGKEMLQEYRSQRETETHGLRRSFRDGACFHDGTKRLNCVDTRHREVQNAARTEDYVTRKVLEIMVKEMLHHRPDRRPHASQLDGKAETVVEDARSELDRAKAISTPQPRQQPTPSQSPVSEQSAAPGADDMPSNGSRIYANGPMILDDLNRVFSSPSASRANTEHGYPTTIEVGDSLPMPSELQEIPEDVVVGQVANWTQDIPMVGQHREPRQLSQQVQTQLASLPSLTTGRARNHTVDSITPRDTSGNTVRHDRQPRSKLPHCSRAQIQAWYDAQKSKRSNAPLPHAENMSSLRDRDHVFIVDDSATMKKHWPDVIELIRVLAYMTKSMDPDGIELYYLRTGASAKFKHSSDLVRSVEHHAATGDTSLDQVFDSYLRKYCKTIDKSKSWKGVFNKLKPCSVYVLTDGVLAAGNHEQGREAIRILVDDLIAHKLPRFQIGVQFISFRNDENGLKLLVGLDTLKMSQGLKLDIIDTEPANGNVWKMLLGAINAKYDNDDVAGDGLEDAG